MRTHPWMANAFPHPRKIRYSRTEVYRLTYQISLGQESSNPAREF
jgi:hypothetical protein